MTVGPLDHGGLTVQRAPRLSANDADVRLIDRLVVDGEIVSKGQAVAVLEGGKAAEEVEATADGILYWAATTGATLEVGAVLAVVCPPGTAREAALTRLTEQSAASGIAEISAAGVLDPIAGARFSRDARTLMAAHGVAPERFAGLRLVTAAMVRSALGASGSAGGDTPPLVSAARAPVPPRFGDNGRVVVVGAGPGASQLLSVLLAERGTVVLGLLDDAPARHGEEILGVRTLGPTANLETMAATRAVDAVIVATPNWPALNRQISAVADRWGLRLANAIHPTAHFDRNVTIGGGCYVGPFCYFGAGTSLGDHCFLSSRTTFEHHNRIGCFIATGPNVATSGQVVVGDGTRFGAGVVVEPGVVIGHGARLASGAVITTNIPSGAVVKGRGHQQAR